MHLKIYQTDLLDAFATYLQRCRDLNDPKAAEVAYQESVRAWRNLSFNSPYSPLPGAEEVPYVCLRVPTGGGKTFLAAHAIEMVHNHYLPSKFTLTLWLVPSDAIRKQTLKILKNKRHPLTRSLSSAIGAIETLDIEESLYLKPSTLDSAHTIIVATMQSFKRDDKTGLRVHRENGELMEHFTRHPKAADEGKHSLVDALRLRLRHPFIILDETHNNGSPLAMDTLAAFRPSTVLELTATRIDQHPNVKWWVRNVEKQLGAFWLQTSRDRFFPDFIAELHDGTIAIIEYKGDFLKEKKSEMEKKDIGEL